MSINPNDPRRVALIKSLSTNNRFYALVTPESGIHNADAITSIPEGLLLGIAYPCLEDGLNDFAVIRTTFETLDLFPEDDPIREEMAEIINDARSNLLRRLLELHDKINNSRAHFLGTDYNEFKSFALAIVQRGYPRRNLDTMMKLNVFSSVAEAEGHDNTRDLLYHYQFSPAINAEEAVQLSARPFIVTLFDDLLYSVKTDANYQSKYLFDKEVFQKFIAVMFVNYATTDPMFYGINRGDYGVSADKDMDDTPLYRSIKSELLEIERRLIAEGDPYYSGERLVAPEFHQQIGTLPAIPANVKPQFTPATEPDFSSAVDFGEMSHDGDTFSDHLTFEQADTLLPSHLVNEEVLMGPITSLCSTAGLLLRKSDPDTQRFAKVIMADASKLVAELKRLRIISDLTIDPGDCGG